MNPTNLRQINDKRVDEAIKADRHNELVLANAHTAKAVSSSVQSLVNYLEGKTTKTEVVNQLTEVGTPDALKVVDAVNDLHTTLKTHENTDLTEVTALLQSLVSETKQIPKTIPTAPTEIKVSNLTDQTKDFDRIEKAIKAQKLDVNVEAPQVNVAAPNVQVDAPNLKPVEKGLLNVLGAIKKLKLDVPKTDLSKLEKNSDKANKILREIADRPIGGGGGGGAFNFTKADGSMTPADTVVSGGKNAIVVSNSDGTPIGGGGGGAVYVSSATITSVSDTATSTTLLASNSNRKGAIVQNTSSAILYLKYGITASNTSFTVSLPSGSYWEMPNPIYTGRIDGVWASDDSGAAVITEM